MMKITKNFIDGQKTFKDVDIGQVFLSKYFYAEEHTYMRISEIYPEVGDVVNAICIEDGEPESFGPDVEVKIIKDVEIILNVEV